MRRTIALPVAVLGALTVLVAVLAVMPHRDATSGKSSARPTILFLGDSITANFFASSARAGFRADFTRAVGGQQVGLAGGPGLTAGEVLAQAAALPPTGADTIVVEVGTNDLVQQVPLATLDGTYHQLVGAALALSAPHPTVLCVGVWDEPRLAAPYDAVMRRVCTAVGGRWVPVSDLFVRPDLHGRAGAPTYLGPADAFHPNDRGHAAIAHRLVTAFRAARP